MYIVKNSNKHLANAYLIFIRKEIFTWAWLHYLLTIRSFYDILTVCCSIMTKNQHLGKQCILVPEEGNVVMCPMEDFAEQPRRRGRPKKQQFASEAIQEEPGQTEHT